MINDTQSQKMARDRAGLSIQRWRLAQQVLGAWEKNQVPAASGARAVIEWIDHLKNEIKRQSAQIEKLKAEIKQLKGWLGPP